MVEPGRVASGGFVQLVARVRNSAEKFNGRRIRGTGRGDITFESTFPRSILRYFVCRCERAVPVTCRRQKSHPSKTFRVLSVAR